VRCAQHSYVLLLIYKNLIWFTLTVVKNITQALLHPLISKTQDFFFFFKIVSLLMLVIPVDIDEKLLSC